MNDLDLRTALHRDADLVGEPSPDLLDQLVRRRQHQRRQRAGMLTSAVAVVVIAAGIPIGTSLLARSDGGPATDPTPTVSTEAPTPSTATPAPATTAPPSSAVPAPTPTAAVEAEPAAPVLGPDGLGSLRLGMTRDQAEATGLVEPFRNEPSSTQCLWSSALTGAPAGEGTVLHSETLGVATIDAYPGVQTPEGITFGSSLAAVESAYPGLVLHDPGFDQNSRTGRGYAPVPGNSGAVYRIVFDDATVVALTLQYGRQDCYE
jgi:hypothetical protein